MARGVNDPHCNCGPKFNSWYAENESKRGPKIGTLETNNGWWVCSNCGLPSLHALNDCEDCGRKFKGIRPGIKFAYACPDCD